MCYENRSSIISRIKFIGKTKTFYLSSKVDKLTNKKLFTVYVCLWDGSQYLSVQAARVLPSQLQCVHKLITLILCFIGSTSIKNCIPRRPPPPLPSSSYYSGHTIFMQVLQVLHVYYILHTCTYSMFLKR